MKFILQSCSIIMAILVSGCNNKPNESLEEESGDKLFSLQSPDQTGVDFSNQLTETEEMNIIEYLYFYNGGGVATGDINNDGLTDIYFTSNQQPNKLFLNKGDFKFEDITKKANAAGKEGWKTGVTMVDINADGFLDIYICKVGKYKHLKGKNELLINNGNLTFSDSAAYYGLDFQGFSTQSLFFDYDRDGDLDMYLLNHAVHTENSYGKASLRFGKDSLAGDRLFQNAMKNGQPYFIDVTTEAKIFSSHIGYGLGVGSGDLNNDGWPDLYVSNDFHENDYLYLNNQDGTFTESSNASLNHSSRFSMGMDIGDINNDGLMDIMTLDMLPENEQILKTSVGDDPYNIYEFKLQYGYHYQFARNALQLNQGIMNNGIPSYSDIGILSGVHASDWSWSTLLTDLDNDGWNDIFITNGIVRRPNDLDYITYHYQNLAKEKVNKDDKVKNLELQKFMPSIKLSNQVYKNTNNLGFKNVGKEWGFAEPSFSNGAAYADFDNDGDLDIVINNINQPAFIYKNNSEKFGKNYIKIKLIGKDKNTFGIGTRLIISADSLNIVKDVQSTKGFLSSVEQTITIGLGEAKKIDSLSVLWPDGKHQSFANVPVNQRIEIKQSASTEMSKNPMAKFVKKEKLTFENISSQIAIDYRHKENRYYDFNHEPLIPKLLSTEGPGIAIGDINNDQMDDIFLGGAKHQSAEIYLQRSNGSFQKTFQPALIADANSEDVDAQWVDVDGDDDLDLIVVSGGNELENLTSQPIAKLYLNNGSGLLNKVANNIPQLYGNGSCIAINDYDQDGDMDVFVGCRSIPGKYGDSPSSFLLNNNGKGHFTESSDEVMPFLKNIGMVTDAEWGDVDGDGSADLVIVGEWMPIGIFANVNGKFNPLKQDHLNINTTSGWWNTVKLTDIDDDGDNDLVVGNLGLNSKIKADSSRPAQMYIGDFDNDGKVDPVICYYKNGISYPAISRDKLLNQLNYLKDKYVNYKDFGDATIADIFDKEQLESASVKEAMLMKSCIFINSGNGNLTIKPFPNSIQIAPINSIVINDFDKDGKKDILLGGNFYGVEPDMGRYDASKGHLLWGTGGGNFKEANNQALQLFFYGEIRDLKVIKGKNEILMITRNNQTPQFYQWK